LAAFEDSDVLMDYVLHIIKKVIESKIELLITAFCLLGQALFYLFSSLLKDMLAEQEIIRMSGLALFPSAEST
jgi:hypothetical protein